MYEGVLLIDPTYYYSNPGEIQGNIAYALNDFTKQGVAVDRARAFSQTENLTRSLLALHLFVIRKKQPRGSPDAVFCANGAFVVPGTNIAVIAKFRHKERQREERFFKRLFQDLGFICLTLPRGEEYAFEGAGDAQVLYIKGRRYLVLGYGPRTTLRGARYVAGLVGTHFDSIYFWKLHTPWYHLDVPTNSMREEAYLYYPGAFEPSVQRFIENLPHSIEVSEKDARNFVCNGIFVPQNERRKTPCYIVDQRISTSLERELARRGIKVIKIDLSEFNKAGGSAYCLHQFF